MRAIIVAACILTSTLGACRASTPVDTGTGGPSGDPAATGSPSPSFSPGDPSVTRSPTAGTSTNGASPSAAPRAFRTIGSVDDPRGDAGTESRPYNDLLGVRIQDDGSNARILVRLNGALPKRDGDHRMPDGEQMGIGVDLFLRADAEEGDYQVFATGTSEGWEAFFETPNGFVKYPGEFRIRDDTILEFVIRWSDLGNIKGSRFTTFLDWDREAIAVGIAGQDRAPDGTARGRFSR
ncbi:MAG TPA: hypothetical protein VGB52_08640 [Actinomycetota bacterium]